MSFANTRQALAYAAEHLGDQLFETEEYRKQVKQALDASKKWHQRECPLKAPLVVCFVFMMMLHRSLSLADLLVKLLAQYRVELVSLSLKALTPEAVCHARERLGPEPLRLILQAQAAMVRPASGVFGMRFWAIDGVAFNVPDTPANEKHFGRPKASRGVTAFPQFKAVALVDTTTRQIGAVDILDPKGSERDGAIAVLEHVQKGDVILLDRGYPAAWLFALCNKRRVRFIARVSSSWKPTILKTLGPGDHLVQVEGTVPKAHRKLLGGHAKATVKLRMLEYQIAGHTMVRLLTDLLDPKVYPALEVAKSYHLRWECELSYDELKNHLATVATGSLDLVFRSKSPQGVLQEFYALLALYNMIRGMMAEAGQRYGISPLDLSFTSTVRLVRETTPRYQAAYAEERVLILEQLLKDIAELRNTRPRRARQCPRAVKVKMTKFPLKRKRHRECRLEVDRGLKMGGGGG